MFDRRGCSGGFFIFWRCIIISKNEHHINDEIRDKEIRLIGADGAQLGIANTNDALKMALTANLDLVKIAPKAVPPVCKIMDYGKFRFEQAKREKEARKNQHVIDVKEIQLSIGIGSHDLEFKVKNANKFLNEGNKAKVVVRFRGRELAHTDMGTELLKKFADNCSELGVIEKPAKLEGKNMTMFLAPNKNKA